MTTETLYKLTTDDGRPVHGGSGRWNLPNGKRGKWRSVRGELVPCSNGLHVLRVGDIAHWLSAGTLWEVEAGTEQIDHGDKIVVRKARLVREAARLDDKTLRLLAADFADHVLHLFEKRRPNDLRPREAIAAARAFARGEIDRAVLNEKRAAAADAYAAAAYAAAAADAYAAAAYAASAAAAASDAYAAAAYAAYAASAAAYAAAYAASAAAARSQERAWQAQRVAEVLGLR